MSQDTQMQAPHAELLTAADVARKCRVTARTVHRWRRTGRLPAPVRLSGKTVRWQADAINTWLARSGAMQEDDTQ